MSAQFKIIARIGKVRGLDGKVTAHAADGLPFCLQEGLECHVVPPALYGPRRVRISKVEELSGTLVLSFAGVDDVDAAQGLVGRKLLAAVDDLDVDDDPAWFIGYSVHDERYGLLGEVTELIETPANDVLVIEGRYGEVLVPVVDGCVLSIPSPDDECFRTHVMDGLVDARGEDA